MASPPIAPVYTSTTTPPPAGSSLSTTRVTPISYPPPIPDLSPEFPRINHKIGLYYYAGMRFGPNQSHLECVWAARKASQVWRKGIEDRAKRIGRAIDETKVAVDDTCFALAVFDKVWEIHYWERLQNVPYQRPTRTYKEWYYELEDVIVMVYKLACSHFHESHTPPPLDPVNKLVRRCLRLWVSKHDVCDPPVIDYSAFDVSVLGPYASRYWEHSYVTLQNHESSPGNYVKEVVRIPADPWPPTKPVPSLRSSPASSSIPAPEAMKTSTPAAAEQATRQDNGISAKLVDDLGDGTPPAAKASVTPARDTDSGQ